MIKTKLLLMEYATVSNSPSLDSPRLNAIRSIRNLLVHIDFTAESVPLESSEKLQELLVSLKGGPLTMDEILLVEELIMSPKK